VNQAPPPSKPITDWLTVAAIAGLASSLNVAFHEGVHAVTCLAAGGDLQEYSALHVLCEAGSPSAEKIVAGSASIANLIAGTLLWLILRRVRTSSGRLLYFLWLLMLVNWLYGAGYWTFSGIGNIGDWAVVIDGWEPHWLWRIGMAVAGAALFMGFVWLALCEWGKLVGGGAGEQIGRSSRICLISYFASVGVVLLAGLFNPYGFFSLPVTAGLLAALGALSPLLWMMQWFKAESFAKLEKPPLEIERSWAVVGVAGAVIFVYAFILGRTLEF
jgi:hypothetical protein